jgi:hypothetical protein
MVIPPPRATGVKPIVGSAAIADLSYQDGIGDVPGLSVIASHSGRSRAEGSLGKRKTRQRLVSWGASWFDAATPAPLGIMVSSDVAVWTDAGTRHQAKSPSRRSGEGAAFPPRPEDRGLHTAHLMR